MLGAGRRRGAASPGGRDGRGDVVLDWDRSRLSHQIRRMEQRGLLTRGNCPTDARGTVIGLTEHGWTTIQQAAPGHVQAVRVHFFDVLTDADIVALDDICRRVNTRIPSLDLDLETCAEAEAEAEATL